MREHEASSLFPLLDGADLDALCADIKKNGQQEPIYRLEGKVVDGRNRLRACRKLGLDPWVEDLDPSETPDPFALVMSLNWHRRHLTPLQKGQALKRYLEARGGKKQGKGRPTKNGQTGQLPTVSGVAKELGVPRKTAERHLKTAEDYEALPKPIKAKVDSGQISVGVAKKAAGNVEKAAAKQADQSLPKDVVAVFDKEAEKVRKINGVLTFLERTASGFAHHTEFALSKRWAKTDRDIIQRHIEAIYKHVQTWRKTL